MNYYRVVKWIFFGAVAIFLTHVWLLSKTYLFSEESIAAFAKHHTGTVGFSHK